jgi:hypothetical protein
MANFPTSLDTLTNPTSGNTLDSPSHSLQHSDANDILEALEAKVGIGTSTAGSATAGHALVASTGGTTTWTTIGTAGITSGTATNGQVLTANGSGAVTFNTPSQGLTLINTTSFSGVSTQSINSVFTSAYDNYYVEIDFIVPTTGGDTALKLRSSGTDKSTNYVMSGSSITSTTVANYGTTTTTLIYITSSIATNLHLVKLHISRPAISGQTVVLSDANGAAAEARYIATARQTETTTFDGFTFYNVGSNNMNGKIKVFGVNQ